MIVPTCHCTSHPAHSSHLHPCVHLIWWYGSVTCRKACCFVICASVVGLSALVPVLRSGGPLVLKHRRRGTEQSAVQLVRNGCELSHQHRCASGHMLQHAVTRCKSHMPSQGWPAGCMFYKPVGARAPNTTKQAAQPCSTLHWLRTALIKHVTSTLSAWGMQVLACSRHTYLAHHVGTLSRPNHS